MSQWPPHDDKRKIAALAKAWTLSVPSAEIAELCAIGLKPVTTDKFTVFWCRNKPTALSCTPDDQPGNVEILPSRLVSIALACLWIDMHPLSMASFCRRGVSRHGNQSSFWCGIAAALSFSVLPSKNLYTAALGGTPWQREFVEAAAARLHARGASAAIDSFVELSFGQPWISTRDAVWPIAVGRWISEYELEYAVHRSTSSLSKITFQIYGVNIELVRKRDAVFILLMCLFAKGSLCWGERIPKATELPLPVAYAFSRHTFLHYPEAAPVHRLLDSITRS